MQLIINGKEKDDEKLDVLCGRQIGEERWDSCGAQMDYIQHDLEGVQYKCPKCDNLVVIIL